MPAIYRATKKRTESTVQGEIRDELGLEPRVRLFRNQVGAYCEGGRDDRWITYGLCPGSSDLVGWVMVDVTWPDGVVRRVARWFALEVKAKGVCPAPRHVLEAKLARGGKLSDGEAHDLDQQRWMAAVREAGGFACYVWSRADARAAYLRALSGASE